MVQLLENHTQSLQSSERRNCFDFPHSHIDLKTKKSMTKQFNTTRISAILLGTVICLCMEINLYRC